LQPLGPARLARDDRVAALELVEPDPRLAIVAVDPRRRERIRARLGGQRERLADRGRLPEHPGP
jgi:hypothetical protein